MIVVIDGPAGSGKSTTARLVATRLGFRFLDTGAMYRALALATLEKGYDLSGDIDAGVFDDIDLAVDVGEDGMIVLLDGCDVSDRIRSAHISKAASAVATFPEARAKLTALQRMYADRSMASGSGLVAEGRDMGTVVFPDADVKVFLTAGLKARAVRRFEEERAKDPGTRLELIEQELVLRDRQDSTRNVAPLRQADDAIRIDTSELSVDEQVEAVVLLVLKKKRII